jgi:hypothetical protein
VGLLEDGGEVGIDIGFRTAEKNVEENEFGRAGREIADQFGPDAACPGPAAQLGGEGAVARVIDIDDDDIAIAGRVDGALHAHVGTAVFEPLERAAVVEQPDRQRDGGGECEDASPEPLPGLRTVRIGLGLFSGDSSFETSFESLSTVA